MAGGQEETGGGATYHSIHEGFNQNSTEVYQYFTPWNTFLFESFSIESPNLNSKSNVHHPNSLCSIWSIKSMTPAPSERPLSTHLFWRVYVRVQSLARDTLLQKVAESVAASSSHLWRGWPGGLLDPWCLMRLKFKSFTVSDLAFFHVQCIGIFTLHLHGWFLWVLVLMLAKYTFLWIFYGIPWGPLDFQIPRIHKTHRFRSSWGNFSWTQKCWLEW